MTKKKSSDETVDISLEELAKHMPKKMVLPSAPKQGIYEKNSRDSSYNSSRKYYRNYDLQNKRSINMGGTSKGNSGHRRSNFDLNNFNSLRSKTSTTSTTPKLATKTQEIRKPTTSRTFSTRDRDNRKFSSSDSVFAKNPVKNFRNVNTSNPATKTETENTSSGSAIPASQDKTLKEKVGAWKPTNVCAPLSLPKGDTQNRSRPSGGFSDSKQSSRFGRGFDRGAEKPDLGFQKNQWGVGKKQKSGPEIDFSTIKTLRKENKINSTEKQSKRSIDSKLPMRQKKEDLLFSRSSWEKPKYNQSYELSSRKENNFNVGFFNDIRRSQQSKSKTSERMQPPKSAINTKSKTKTPQSAPKAKKEDAPSKGQRKIIVLQSAIKAVNSEKSSVNQSTRKTTKKNIEQNQKSSSEKPETPDKVLQKIDKTAKNSVKAAKNSDKTTDKSDKTAERDAGVTSQPEKSGENAVNASQGKEDPKPIVKEKNKLKDLSEVLLKRKQQPSTLRERRIRAERMKRGPDLLTTLKKKRLAEVKRKKEKQRIELEAKEREEQKRLLKRLEDLMWSKRSDSVEFFGHFKGSNETVSLELWDRALKKLIEHSEKTLKEGFLKLTAWAIEKRVFSLPRLSASLKAFYTAKEIEKQPPTSPKVEKGDGEEIEKGKEVAEQSRKEILGEKETTSRAMDSVRRYIATVLRTLGDFFNETYVERLTLSENVNLAELFSLDECRLNSFLKENGLPFLLKRKKLVEAISELEEAKGEPLEIGEVFAYLQSLDKKRLKSEQKIAFEVGRRIFEKYFESIGAEKRQKAAYLSRVVPGTPQNNEKNAGQKAQAAVMPTSKKGMRKLERRNALLKQKGKEELLAVEKEAREVVTITVAPEVQEFFAPHLEALRSVSFLSNGHQAMVFDAMVTLWREKGDPDESLCALLRALYEMEVVDYIGVGEWRSSPVPSTKEFASQRRVALKAVAPFLSVELEEIREREMAEEKEMESTTDWESEEGSSSADV